MAVRRLVCSLSPALLVLLFVGCSGDQNPLVPVGELEEKPADSVYRESSPQPRSNNLQNKLAAYRNETYGVTMPTVPHSDVAYTASYRHAVYLNGINSAGWSRVNPSAPDTEEITSASEYEELLLEGTVAPLNGQYPALFTSPELFTRLEAVRGGRDAMNAGNCRASTVFESYVFDGFVEVDEGTTTFFRGFENSRATFDAVDNVWYTRRGRMLLARPSLTYFGYGQKCDDARIACGDVPHPIMEGQFLGVMTTLHSYPASQRLGFWPNNGNADVNPYGLDTDLGGEDPYCGPPIHITIPINQSIPRSTGIRSLTFGRTDNTAPASAPSSLAAWQQFKVFTNVDGLIIPTIAAPVNGQFRAAGPIAPILTNIAVTAVTPGLYTAPIPLAQAYTFTVDAATDLSALNVGDVLVINILAGPFTGVYRYTITGINDGLKTVTVLIPAQYFTTLAPLNPAFPGTAYLNNFDNLKLDFESTTTLTVAGLIDENLRDGELVLVPVQPLQNNTSYTVSFRIVTPSFDSTVQTFSFTTNDNGIYP